MRSRLAGPTLAAFVLAALAASPSRADSVKPFSYGPFVMNQIEMTGSPAGYDYVLSNGNYHFQIGWIEPIASATRGIFQGTYFETDGNLNLSPYYVNIGTTFNLKPFRYLETGLTYNRLLYTNSMATFTQEPSLSDWAPSALMSIDKEPGGADVFTFQSNITVDLSRLQLYIFGSRSQWDVDAAGKNFVYDYVDDFLIHPRDRVNYAMAQLSVDLRPFSFAKYVSYTGFAVRDRYWHSDGTELEKNLISGGITGFRIGRNPEFHRRGLDLSLGYWTRHPQIPADVEWQRRLVIEADWRWIIQVLKL